MNRKIMKSKWKLAILIAALSGVLSLIFGELNSNIIIFSIVISVLVLMVIRCIYEKLYRLLIIPGYLFIPAIIGLIAAFNESLVMGLVCLFFLFVPPIIFIKVMQYKKVKK